jgi:dolichol-phosphate mannosyltransferase
MSAASAPRATGTPRVVVCIPTYNEADNLPEALARTRAALPDADIVVVDDSSPDGTADVAKRLAEELGHIDVLVNPTKGGLGAAYRSAFKVVMPAGYDVICQMDADLSHDPAALPAMIQALVDGAAMAIGSRYVPGGSVPHWPAHRRALSKYGNRYASGVLGLPVSDATAGFRAFWRATLEDIEVATTRATGYGFQIECAYRVHRRGGRIVEVPIIFTDRVRGHSKLSLRVAFEELALVTLWGIRDRIFRRRTR